MGFMDPFSPSREPVTSHVVKHGRSSARSHSHPTVLPFSIESTSDLHRFASARQPAMAPTASMERTAVAWERCMLSVSGVSL